MLTISATHSPRSLLLTARKLLTGSLGGGVGRGLAGGWHGGGVGGCALRGTQGDLDALYPLPLPTVQSLLRYHAVVAPNVPVPWLLQPSDSVKALEIARGRVVANGHGHIAPSRACLHSCAGFD